MKASRIVKNGIRDLEKLNRERKKEARLESEAAKNERRAQRESKKMG